MNKTTKMGIVVAIGVLLWNIPPEGAPVEGWHLLSIFVATIVALIMSIAPMPQVCILAVVIVAVTGVLDPHSSKKAVQHALSGFSSHTVWLIAAAFFSSAGIIKSGLGRRIAFNCLKYFGKSTLGVAYSIYFGNFILSPVVPSISAKTGGIFFPIVLAITKALGSEPDEKTRHKAGKYLMHVGAESGIFTGSAFLTGMAANPLIGSLAVQNGVEFTWTNWFMTIGPISILMFMILPIYQYILIKPELKETPKAREIAEKELNEMGPMKSSEKIIVGIFITMILAWVFGKALHIHATTVILAGVAAMLFSSVITWEDILEQKGGWNAFIWFGSLLMMVSYLGKLGLITWFAGVVKAHLASLGWSWEVYYVSLVVLYYMLHYLFASSTAQAVAFYGTFLVIGISMGVPPLMMAASLALCSNIYGSLTHYGSGSAVPFFSAGYWTVPEWWKMGAFMMLFNLTIIFTAGTAYWALLS